MSRTISPAPVRKSVAVAVPPERAFAFFAGRMGRWWQKRHTLLKTEREDVIIEPWPGGRWFERAVDGSESQWGRVLAWEPPHRLILAWQLDGNWVFDPDLVTELEIRFLPAADGATQVELEHRHLERFGALAERTRDLLDSIDAWEGNLASFASGANRDA